MGECLVHLVYFYVLSGSCDKSSKYFQGFGMSETAGVHTISRADDFRMDSVGRTICGAEIKIDNPDEDGQGEVSQFETSPLIH